MEIKKVPHQKVAVNLLAGEEKNPDYLAKNPAGYLPCLLVDRKAPMGESMAILEWLEENYPQPSFYAGDSHRRALARQLAETVNAGIQPLQNLDVIRRFSDDKEKQAEWARHWIVRGLGVFERLLGGAERGSARFSLADHPTLPDLCLIPQCYAASRFKVDLAAFPQCKAIYEYALTTPECAASRPENFQPSV
jgi:maleylacetoacetate isomerase